MTKVKLKDAIKDLTTDAAKVRDDASRVRQSADGLAKSLRALENGFIKSLNAKAEQEKRAEEEKRLSDHSKAYVMLDVDEQAAVNAVTDPSLSLALDMADQYNGALTVNAHPASLTGSASLTNAVFTDGASTRNLAVGTHPITGTPADGVPSYKIGASMTVPAAGSGAALDLYPTPGAQRLVAAVAGSSTGLSASVESP